MKQTTLTDCIAEIDRMIAEEERTLNSPFKKNVSLQMGVVVGMQRARAILISKLPQERTDME